MASSYIFRRLHSAASVTVYSVDPFRGRTAVVGAGTTDSSGRLSLTLPTLTPGAGYVAESVYDGVDSVAFGEPYTGPATVAGTSGGTPAAGQYATYATAAGNPDLLIAGAITRDANGAATSAPVVWPDGTPGTYTGTPSSAFPGAVDSYTITYGSPATVTYTQPTVTRDASGAVTVRPAIAAA